jgi:hypothetical protein
MKYCKSRGWQGRRPWGKRGGGLKNQGVNLREPSSQNYNTRGWSGGIKDRSELTYYSSVDRKGKKNISKGRIIKFKAE